MGARVFASPLPPSYYVIRSLISFLVVYYFQEGNLYLIGRAYPHLPLNVMTCLMVLSK
nr:hypothetical protein Q903MT_gene3312 [Picea sitchensis]